MRILSLFFTLALTSTAHAADGTIRVDHTSEVSASSARIGTFATGGQTYEVRCHKASSKLACGVYKLPAKAGKGSATLLSDTHVTSFSASGDGAVARVAGKDGSTTVEASVHFLNRDPKEKLSYIAMDYEGELEE